MLPVVTVVATTLSPYQVELFDAVAKKREIDLKIVYIQPSHADRLWTGMMPHHDHRILTEIGSAAIAQGWIEDSNLVVFAWYADKIARTWMAHRAALKRPWCYWGERPGFRRLPLLGRLRRFVRLAPLRKSNAPIWGMGNWAVEGWRREFGTQRSYFNVPYFSDLNRFARTDDTPKPTPSSFLYSGSLIQRKGVDLLADAYGEVAKQVSDATLTIVGYGPLEAMLRQKLAPFADRVRFFGFQPWEKLPEFYHAAGVLVAPSRYDGWGLIVPEGLAAGLPVIATEQMGSARDLLQSEINGWMIPAGDHGALTQAMLKATRLPLKKYEEMVTAAYESVANHSLNAGADTFINAAMMTLAQWQ